MKKVCEVCGSKNLKLVLDLGQNPLCDDLIEINSRKKNNLYKIQILLCKKCITGFQNFEVKKKKLFPKSYHYRARFTNDVLNGFKEIFKISENYIKNFKKKKILDIGCNDGSLLNLYKKKNAITVGVEPTGAALDAKKNGHNIYQTYFDKETTNKLLKKYKKFDFIIFTNVFAHIENLQLLIKNLKKLISDETVLIIENHYFGSIIEKNQFDTFYHEHPRTYSATSFLFIAKKLGMSIDNLQFPRRYGGNIRVVFTKKKLKSKKEIIQNKEKNFVKEILKMQKRVNKWKVSKKKFINKLYLKNGPMIAKAFPGRAAILVRLLNLNKKIISSVYEKKGSMKIGNYVPGTKIPIKSDSELIKIIKSTKIIINFAWHISKEIKKYLRSRGYRGKIYNIIEKKDFTIY
ncbi:methyltransferase domain-containing protein [Candidatus Pelagibacter sp.]|nr:methyltransferase domain-containing protein [Candidatus Pelagibacter sp.]